MHWKTVTALAGLAMLLSAPLPAAEPAEPPEGVERITHIEGISEYRLDNGLKVLLFPDASKPNVTVSLTLFVGSRHEGYGEAGMAHLLEHMLFKGTPTHPNIPQSLQSRGARFNGTTWVDRTNYYQTLPAGDDNLEFAIRMEADRMVNSTIRQEDLDSEMTVVRNEFERGENSPYYILSQRMLSAAYDWHNYGKSTIGNRADIERVPIENLRKFYRRYYRPDNAMLVVAGRFDPQKALEYAQEHFGPIPRPEQPLPKTYTEEPAQDGERFVTLRRVGDVAVVGATYHIPAGPHPDYVALDVLESILTAPPSGRLYKALVETRRASGVSGNAFAWHDPGVLLIMAEVVRGNEPEVVLHALLDELQKVAQEGVSDEEVERARQRLFSERERAASDTSGIAVELSEWAAQGDWRLYFLYRDRLEEVTADDVKRVAATYLKRNNRTVGLYIPTRRPQRVTVPAIPDLQTMIGDYQGRDDVVAGEEFDVSPEAIEARTQRLTLPDGPKTALLEKKTRGQAVHLRLTLRYGDEQSLQGLVPAGELLPALVLRGTRQLSRGQLQDELDRLRAELNASGSAGEATFTLETRREHLPAALKLLKQILRDPALPESEFEILRQERLGSLERRLSDPDALAMTAIRRALNPYEEHDPRHVPTLEAEVERVRATTHADVKRLYDEFLSAQHGELAVVGDFDADDTLPLLTEMFSGWQARRPYSRLERRNFEVKAGATKIETPDKANAMYLAATAFPVRDDDPDHPAIALGDFLLGAGSLASRLGTRIREQEGLAYGVGSQYQALSLDRRASFVIYASTNPGNVARVTSAIREELERLLKDGVAEEELETARQGFLRSRQVSRTDDSRLTRLLAETLETDRTMQYHADFERAVGELTPDGVITALRKHLDPERLVIVTAGDFAAARKDAPQDRTDD